MVSSVYQNRLEIYPSMAPNNWEWVHNANIHGGLWFPLTKCHCIIIFKVFAHYFAQIWQGAVISINPAIKSNYESGRKWWWLMGRGGKWDRRRAVNWSSRNFTVPGKGPYQGLLLVESAYKCYHNKIYLRLRILAPCLLYKQLECNLCFNLYGTIQG